MKRLELIMIDCWGTILLRNPAWDDVILETIVTFLEERGKIERDVVFGAFEQEAQHFRRALVEQEVTHPIGDRVSFLFERLGFPADSVDSACMCQLIEECITRPHPAAVRGCKEFLERMQNALVSVCLVCNTGWFSGAAITSALEQLGLTRYLKHLVFSDAHGAAKPARSIFLCGLRLAGCPPSAAVHVGDTWSADVLGAMRAGVYPIQLVLGDEVPKRRAHASLQNYQQIYEHLRKHFRW